MAEMDRDEIKAFMGLSVMVEHALNALPYRDALPAIQKLGEMRDLVGEQLPGGYFGSCAGCDEVKGFDEMVSGGDEWLCQDCMKTAPTEPELTQQA